LELTQILVGVIRHGLEIHPNGQGKLRFGTCSNLNWGNRTRSRNSSKRSGKIRIWNLLKSHLGNRIPSGNSSKRLGKIEILNLLKSQLGNRTRSGNSSKRSGKIGIWNLLKSQLRKSDQWIYLVIYLFFSSFYYRIRYNSLANFT
jgi:hypothetical protein